ncbi:MAG TPA: nuclease-related domain-containing protein [Acidimicrobiales bacterium]|jgi:hypothetical protein|nr:nuclease-related domain-containing protein [Acidimicrobiales bacterium]
MGQPEDSTAGIRRGEAGASARAEYERRQAKDETRRRALFGPLAPVARLLAGPKSSTEAWGRGADGEERVGHWLDRAVGGRGVVLHDRALPQGRANIDHLVVTPSGVWVVDTKHFRGRLERRELRGWFVPRPRLFVAGRDQSRLLTSARRQQALVAEALAAGQAGPGAPVRVALCFTGAQVGLFTRPFTLEGVLVTWPRAFARILAAAGPLSRAERRALADRLAQAFPPYAPGGTSHRPTGASPRR